MAFNPMRTASCICPSLSSACESSTIRYYTGPIYETIVEGTTVGSVTGGGRYDRLIELFAGRSLPAVGTSFGIERLISLMEERNLFPPALPRTTTQVLAVVFEGLPDESIRTAAMLRQAGLRAQLYGDPSPLRAQLGYASSRGIPIVAIPGPDEVAHDRLTVRNLVTQQQATLDRQRAIHQIQEWLAQT
jgi:histidyl-tRNA synthetase